MMNKTLNTDFKNRPEEYLMSTRSHKVLLAITIFFLLWAGGVFSAAYNLL